MIPFPLIGMMTVDFYINWVNHSKDLTQDGLLEDISDLSVLSAILPFMFTYRY